MIISESIPQYANRMTYTHELESNVKELLILLLNTQLIQLPCIAFLHIIIYENTTQHLSA